MWQAVLFDLLPTGQPTARHDVRGVLMTPPPRVIRRKKPLPRHEELAKQLLEELKVKTGSVTIRGRLGGVAGIDVHVKVK